MRTRGIQVGDSSGGDTLVARSLERVNLALDCHHIRVRFSVLGQQARILSLQAWQVLRIGRNGPAVGGLGRRAGVGCGQFQLQVAQFFLCRLVVAVHFAELKLGTREHAHAQLLVLRQCVGVGLLEVGQLVFQVGQLGTKLVGFLGENSVVSVARSVRCFMFSLRNSDTSSSATSLATSARLSS